MTLYKKPADLAECCWKCFFDGGMIGSVGGKNTEDCG